MAARAKGISCDVAFSGQEWQLHIVRAKAHGVKVHAQPANSLSPQAASKRSASSVASLSLCPGTFLLARPCKGVQGSRYNYDYHPMQLVQSSRSCSTGHYELGSIVGCCACSAVGADVQYPDKSEQQLS